VVTVRPVIHVLTVHHRSARWIDVQAGYLRRHLAVPYRTYASLEGIDERWHDRFDVVVPSAGRHAGKLNLLARVALDDAVPDDTLMFLDGDAFPIADPVPTVEKALATTALVAVRRDENLGDPQPHPCFCVTTAGTWSDLGGDWSNGPSWTNRDGRVVSDVGATMLWLLDRAGLTWTPLLRSNRRELHPVLFGVYAGVVYHHGAGYRPMVTRVDVEARGIDRRWPGPLGRVVPPVLRAIQDRRNRRLSDEVFEHLARDPEFYRRFL
jgi:hypothetical protein